MPSPTGLLVAATVSDAARPRLTWYDDATGERVELSGATLRTWVAKTAHFLAGDLAVGAGSTVSVALPLHWTAAVWWLAADAVGARLVDPTSPDASTADVAVVGPDAVDDPPRADEVVAVSMRPMGAPFDRDLPALVHDFAAEVRGQPDEYPFDAGRQTRAGDEAAGLAAEWQLSPSDRLLVVEEPGTATWPLTDLWAALAANASVVWLRNPRQPLDVQPLVAEQVTAVVRAPDLPWPQSVRRLGPASVSFTRHRPS